MACNHSRKFPTGFHDPYPSVIGYWCPACGALTFCSDIQNGKLIIHLYLPSNIY